MPKILVAYASKHQSTAEIANYIGRILRENQLDIDVKNIDDIYTIDEYTTVIVGSAVYMGHWLNPAVKFLQYYQNQLTTVPVWIFSTGPTGKGDPCDLLDGFLMPENIRNFVDVISPRHVMLFHGMLDRTRLGIGERMMVKAVNAPVGDFRDWDMIRAWTNRIIAELQTNGILPMG